MEDDVARLRQQLQNALDRNDFLEESIVSLKKDREALLARIQQLTKEVASLKKSEPTDDEFIRAVMQPDEDEDVKLGGSSRFEPLDDDLVVRPTRVNKLAGEEKLGRDSSRRRAPPPPPPSSSSGGSLSKTTGKVALAGTSPDESLDGSNSRGNVLLKSAELFKNTFTRSSSRRTDEDTPTLSRPSMRPGVPTDSPSLSRGSQRPAPEPPVATPILSRSSARPVVGEESSNTLSPPPSSQKSPTPLRTSPRQAEGSKGSDMKVVLTEILNVQDVFKKVALFVLEVSCNNGDCWKLARRYNQFHNLFQDLQAKTSRTLTFPPKKFALAMDESKLKKRKIFLQKFLNEVLEMSNLSATVEFTKFLDPFDSPSVASLNFQDVVMSGVITQLVEMPFGQLERHERYCMVVGCFLYCFKDANSVEALNCISLDYCTMDLEGQTETGAWSFSVRHLVMQRPTLFETSAEAECKKWVLAMRRARADVLGVKLDANEKEGLESAVVVAEEGKGADILRRFVHGKSIRLSTFTTVPDTVSSMVGSNAFSHPDEADFIVVKEQEGGGKIVSAATIEKMIEKLTHPDFYSSTFTCYFLLTYRATLSPQQLLSFLLARYHHVNLVESRRAFRAGALARNPVHDRVCHILEAWIDLNIFEFIDDPDLTRRLLAFVFSALEGNILMHEFAERIKEKVKTKIAKSDHERQMEKAAYLENAPSPIIPQVGLNMSLLVDVDPLEVARQIALFEHELFCKLRSPELLGQKWSKEKTKPLCPNVINVISRFNLTSSWVIFVILGAKTAQVRAALMGRLISIAQSLRDLRAFGPACAIIGGLLSPPILRLKKTKELVSEEVDKSLKDLEHLIAPEKNHKFYRSCLEKAIAEKAPCVPYLGLYLADLTFIEDGNPDMKSETLINFDKRSMLGKVLAEIIHFQEKPYCLKPVPAIQYILTTLDNGGLNEQTAYKLSLELEPREPTQ